MRGAVYLMSGVLFISCLLIFDFQLYFMGELSNPQHNTCGNSVRRKSIESSSTVLVAGPHKEWSPCTTYAQDTGNKEKVIHPCTVISKVKIC